MKQYLDLVRRTLDEGYRHAPDTERTGTGCVRILGPQLRFNLKERFPLLTTRTVDWNTTVRELLWFLSGSTNYKTGHPSLEKWWQRDANPRGELGPIYGHQWRKLQVDQLEHVINSIQTHAGSRRHVVSLWNVEHLSKQELQCCHGLGVVFTVQDGDLHCNHFQRSGDLMLGVPVNIASYALLTHIIAKICGLGVGEYIHTIADAHIYDNQVPAARELIERLPQPQNTHVKLSKYVTKENILALKTKLDVGDFRLEGYAPQGPLSTKIPLNTTTVNDGEKEKP